MDLKIGKKIGEGISGVVCRCIYNGKPAIAKFEKHRGALNSAHPYMRQIAFNEFAKKHPKRFLTLLFSCIMDKCMFEKTVPADFKKWSKEDKADWLDLQKNGVCVLLIYSPVLNIPLNTFVRTFIAIDKLVVNEKVN